MTLTASKLLDYKGLIAKFAIGFLVLAILLPGSYFFDYLRIVICTAAIAFCFFNRNNLVWLLIFILIAYLFNPFYPIYLFIKLKWIPIDILTGLFFYLQIKPVSKQESNAQKTTNNNQKSFYRDRIK